MKWELSRFRSRIDNSFRHRIHMKTKRPIKALRPQKSLNLQDRQQEGQTFKKTYEDVFVVRNPSEKWDELQHSFRVNNWDPDAVVERIGDVMRMQLFFAWDAFTRVFWLRQRMAGKQFTKQKTIGKTKFLQLVENSTTITTAEFEESLNFRAFRLYVDDLLPTFYASNPWDHPDDYEFPFSWITPAYLIPITFYERRLFLLKQADEQKMTYAQFIDFTINDVLSFNEHIEEERYAVSHKNPVRGIYIRRMKPILPPKKK